MTEAANSISIPPAPRTLTHYLFRYPAKFHPPIIQDLLQRFTAPGDVVLDPFVGSGTTLVECAVGGRSSIGLDVDPVAVAVSRAKTRKYDLDEVRDVSSTLLTELAKWERSANEYRQRMFEDLTTDEYAQEISTQQLWVPAIPRLDHWFRRYVTVDLARIFDIIRYVDVADDVRRLLEIIAASTIRNSSNADPVPVSGLEYTAHMRKKDEAGRLINPFAQFRSALKKAITSVEQFSSIITPGAESAAYVADARYDVERLVSTPVDAVITSPPYHNAVDYYRRHQLEMFWLRLTTTQEDRLEILPRYIGRPHIPQKDPLLSMPWNPGPITARWEQKMLQSAQNRARDFRHYVQAMTMTFEQISKVTAQSAPIVVVVGHSAWNGEEIPTAQIFEEISGSLTLCGMSSYKVTNRYMSYSRRNSANIDEEFVLEFRHP